VCSCSALLHPHRRRVERAEISGWSSTAGESVVHIPGASMYVIDAFLLALMALAAAAVGAWSSLFGL
jgi:hypothetical protein